MSENNAQAWKANMNIYLPAGEIVAALQDLGKWHTTKQKGIDVVKHKYPLVDKLAGNLHSEIITEFKNPEGLAKNKTRGKQFLYKDIVQSCRHRDISETNPFFHQFGKDGKVNVITNDPRHAGIDVCIDNFQGSIAIQVQQKNTARNSQNGLRLGYILLNSQYRSSLSGMLFKKKDRKKSDVQGDLIDLFLRKYWKNLITMLSML